MQPQNEYSPFSAFNFCPMPQYWQYATLPSLSYYYVGNFQNSQDLLQTPIPNLPPLPSGFEMLQLPKSAGPDLEGIACSEQLSDRGQGQVKTKNNSCNCSRSMCLKQYCLCFKNGEGCGDQCKCIGCKNSEPRLNERQIKRVRNSKTCNCTKSKCTKKYCECYALGKKCGEECGCINCQN